MLKMVKVLLIAVMVLFAAQAFAFNSANLSNAMNTAAYAGEYLNELMHPGMPKPWTNPMYLTMSNKLADAWKDINKEIGSIESQKEIDAAWAVVNSFKASQGTYRDLGYQVEISLKERIKFLELQN